MIGLYSNIEMITKFQKNAKTDCEKKFFKLMKMQCLKKP